MNAKYKIKTFVLINLPCISFHSIFFVLCILYNWHFYYFSDISSKNKMFFLSFLYSRNNTKNSPLGLHIFTPRMAVVGPFKFLSTRIPKQRKRFLFLFGMTHVFLWFNLVNIVEYFPMTRQLLQSFEPTNSNLAGDWPLQQSFLEAKPNLATVTGLLNLKNRVWGGLFVLFDTQGRWLLPFLNAFAGKNPDVALVAPAFPSLKLIGIRPFGLPRK